MNQQHVIDSYLTEASASIRHCPHNLLNNVEWLSAEVMIFCVKSQQSILFSLVKIWPGPTKDFVAEAGSPIPQAAQAHSDGDVFHLCLYKPACAHISTARNHGPKSGFHAGVFSTTPDTGILYQTSKRFEMDTTQSLYFNACGDNVII